MTDRSTEQYEIEDTADDAFETEAAPQKKGWLTSLSEGFNARVVQPVNHFIVQPVNNFVVTPLKCVFDLAAMPVRDAFVYPFQNVRGQNMGVGERTAKGVQNLGINAAIGGGVAAAAGFLLPVIPVSATIIAVAAIYGVPLTTRVVHAVQHAKSSKSAKNRAASDKTSFFPSLRK